MRQPFRYAAPILIVDDQQAMVDLIMRYLQKIGFEDLDGTTDGSEALNMLKKKQYALVISDLNMEHFGGLQLLRSVRSDDNLRKTRFLMATGDLTTGHVAIAKKLGVDSYLLKPFSRTQLELKLAEMGGLVADRNAASL